MPLFQSPRRGKESWLLNFKCVLLSCDCYCFVFLPSGTVDLSVVLIFSISVLRRMLSDIVIKVD